MYKQFYAQLYPANAQGNPNLDNVATMANKQCYWLLAYSAQPIFSHDKLI